MIEFEFRLHRSQSGQDVWSKLVDIDQHTRAVPLTIVQPAGETMVTGMELVAITKLGPFRLRDQMRVEQAQPPSDTPGKLVIAKLRPFKGRIVAEVTPGEEESTLVWSQQMSARLPASISVLIAKLISLGYRRSVQRIID